MRQRIILSVVLAFQTLSAFFFISQMAISVFGLRIGPISWRFHEIIEVAAAIGLVSGVVISVLALEDERIRTRRAEEALRLARSAFRDVLEERFAQWELTPAERDVAMFAVKGFSTQDMAKLRGVSEGTIKAQTAAIYRKAGVSGRPQFLSLFIDELIETEGD